MRRCRAHSVPAVALTVAAAFVTAGDGAAAATTGAMATGERALALALGAGALSVGNAARLALTTRSGRCSQASRATHPSHPRANRLNNQHPSYIAVASAPRRSRRPKRCPLILVLQRPPRRPTREGTSRGSPARRQFERGWAEMAVATPSSQGPVSPPERRRHLPQSRPDRKARAASSLSARLGSAARCQCRCGVSGFSAPRTARAAWRSRLVVGVRRRGS